MQTDNHTRRLLLAAAFVLAGLASVMGQQPAARYSSRYQTVCLDSTFDRNVNASLARYVAARKGRLDKKMGVKVGRTEEALFSSSPQSSLSNFLTDLLLAKAPAYAGGGKCDVSILNFGGIRSCFPKGDITVGDVYKVSPFDNYIVTVTLRGSELQRVVDRFRFNKMSAAYSGMEIQFRDNVPEKVLVGGRPIVPDSLYVMATLNFISEGGDGILSDINYESSHYTPVVFRDFILAELKNMTRKGLVVSGKEDARAVSLDSSGE